MTVGECQVFKNDHWRDVRGHTIDVENASVIVSINRHETATGHVTPEDRDVGRHNKLIANHDDWVEHTINRERNRVLNRTQLSNLNGFAQGNFTRAKVSVRDVAQSVDYEWLNFIGPNIDNVFKDPQKRIRATLVVCKRLVVISSTDFRQQINARLSRS